MKPFPVEIYLGDSDKSSQVLDSRFETPRSIDESDVSQIPLEFSKGGLPLETESPSQLRESH